MRSWNWVWLASGLVAIAWATAAHHSATEENDNANAATPALQATRPVPPLTSFLWQTARSAGATTGVAGYSLDFYGNIPAPWLDQEPPDYNESSSFGAVEIGDVTGDGRDDVIAVLHGGWKQSGYGALLVYAQTSEGTIAPGVRYPLPADTDGSNFSAIGDFNEDGKQDIVVVGYKKFTMFVSQTGGGFATDVHEIYGPVELGSETPAMPMDVNRDGHLDLVFFMSRTHAGNSGVPTAETHSRIVVNFGDGHGGFAARWSAKTYGANEYDVEKAMSLDTGDVNRDGFADLAIRTQQYDYGMQRSSHQVRIFTSTAQGQLLPTMSIPATMETGASYAALDYIGLGDFNGDGRQDIVGSSGGMDLRLWIKLQSANGTYDTAPLLRTTQPIGVPVEVADLDNSGKDDVLIGHDGWARVTYYLQSAGQLGEEQMRDIPNSDARIGPSGLAVGDLNGDGCKDAVAAQGYYGLYFMRGSNCAVARPVANDYDGDGKSDLAWRNVQTGANTVWKAASNANQLDVVDVTNLAWKIVGQGDFDGDRKADLVWRNSQNGANTLWRSANQATQTPLVGVNNPAWAIVGVGDFNRDGKSDLAWRNGDGRNVVWYSGNAATQQVLATVTSASWRIVGVGDFDADGTSDLLWRNGTTGANSIWRSANNATQVPITGVFNPAWRIQGVGDFDGDGKSDVFWRNVENGNNTIWRSGSSAQQVATMGVTSQLWRVVAVGDYDGDGKSDLAWRNAGNGANTVWRSGSPTNQLPVSRVDNLAWTVVPYENQL